MSVTTALYTGVSGLLASGESMNVIGNNISNVNTTGFKEGRTLFSDLLSQNTGKSSQVGTGVQVQAVQNIFTQGSAQASENVTDLAVQGNSFFALQSPTSPATTQNTAYLSRDGAFSVNKDLQLVNADGYQVLDTAGKPIVFVNSGTSPSTDFGKITKIDPNGVITYLATDGVTQNYYNASGGVVGANGDDAVSSAVSGATNAATLASAASANLLTAANKAVNDVTALGLAPGDATLTANANASLAAAKTAFAAFIAAANTAKTATDTAALAGTNAATANPTDTLLGLASGKATAAQAAVNTLVGDTAITAVSTSVTAPLAADYLTAANAANADFTAAGTGVNDSMAAATTAANTAAAASGTTAGRAVTVDNAKTVQRIALVTVKDPDALTKAGGSLYQSNANSGVSTAAFSLTANSPDGTSETILSNSLEQSNVDMASEFVKMITTQRAYSANSKTITTADQMTQDVLALIR